jgi:hypothetical protein
MALIPPPPYNKLSEDGQTDALWKGWFERLRYLINNNVISTAWANITGTPTTLAGYGITNAQTVLTNSAGLAAALSDETGTGAAVFANTPTLVTPVLGAATGTSVTLTGDITTGTGTLHKTSANLTDGAGAAAGTLGNAPTAGNPTKWVPIDDNGTTRYIPTWT